jgi:hypothetical protein
MIKWIAKRLVAKDIREQSDFQTAIQKSLTEEQLKMCMAVRLRTKRNGIILGIITTGIGFSFLVILASAIKSLTI